MKKILITLCALFICTVSHAQTETMNWYVEGALYDTTTCESGGDIDLPAITPTKRGYTFQGWWTYTPIEYLESTGTQYIDTGHKPNQDTRVFAGYEKESGKLGVVFGARNGLQNAAFTIMYTQASGLIFDYGAERSSVSMSSSWFDNFIKVDFNKNILEISGINSNPYYKKTFNTTTFQTDHNMIIYGLNNAGSKDKAPGIKIYYFQIYDNDTLVRDFVPVLDYNGVPCMFDKVTETFFYNQGTGDFIAGPIVAEE